MGTRKSLTLVSARRGTLALAMGAGAATVASIAAELLFSCSGLHGGWALVAAGAFIGGLALSVGVNMTTRADRNAGSSIALGASAAEVTPIKRNWTQSIVCSTDRSYRRNGISHLAIPWASFALVANCLGPTTSGQRNFRRIGFS